MTFPHFHNQNTRTQTIKLGSRQQYFLRTKKLHQKPTTLNCFTFICVTFTVIFFISFGVCLSFLLPSFQAMIRSIKMAVHHVHTMNGCQHLSSHRQWRQTSFNQICHVQQQTNYHSYTDFIYCKSIHREIKKKNGKNGLKCFLFLRFFVLAIAYSSCPCFVSISVHFDTFSY